MQKMGLLRNVLKSGYLIRVGHQNQGISSFLRDSPRAFSTAAQGTPTQDSSSVFNPFFYNPNTGVTYGKLAGITNHTTKNDVLHLLEDSNLTLEDLKVEYNLTYFATGMLIQFPSRTAYDNAIRTLGRKNRSYRLFLLDPEIWQKESSFNGKAVLLKGIPRNALQDDIDRFLSGCPYDGTSMRIFTRYTKDRVPIRMAIVEFPSAILARHAFLTTIREFILNYQVSVQVLQ